MNILKDKTVAILVTDGFEESEFTVPKETLESQGATVHVVSLKSGNIKAWADGNWSNEYKVDKTIDEANASDYNSLMLPGGVINPDLLRVNTQAVEFVKHFFADGKPIAAICHGPWTMIETGALEGRKVTSYKSIKSDLINAGANWVDEEVVVDQGLVTSRSPNDLPAFCKKMLEEFCEGVHEGQMTV